ncbi:MAG: TetR/AcrR family transcriptional regulator [Mycolicibacterium neoaurum]|uniref:TetR/AcrR family transcriptional regulator n=1 Tax=Mycolicibacterium neoaurum TaxID=1795 RepID=UPI002FFC1715
MPRPRVPDRRERVLAAARDLALTQGWSGTTIAEIAARAGIGKGAVYLEFPDKPAILSAVLTGRMRALTADVHRRVLAADGLVDLPTVYRFGVESILADPLMRAMYLGDEAVLGDHVRGVSDDRYTQRFTWLADYVVALQNCGLIDPRVAVDPLVRMLGVFTIGLLNGPEATDDQLRDTVATFADLVGRGLATGDPVDPEAARRAQLVLLDRLELQLRQLEAL